MWALFHGMGRYKTTSGVVVFVRLARLGRERDVSSFVLFVQLPRIVVWGKLTCQWIRFLSHVD